jgi:Zn-dependent protease
LAQVTTLGIAHAVIFIAMFVIISGPVHECAHAFVAWRLGDGTAKLFGRISLDPIRHFDPLGGTLLIGSTILNLVSTGSPTGFGWAKPTPVNPYNLRGRHAESLVAAAGPLSNLALAGICAVGFRILWGDGVYPNNLSALNMLQLVFFTGMQLNVLLMVFNLIPIPPLDGSHVLFDFLDPKTSHDLQGVMNQYGMLLLVVVVLFGGAFIFQLVDPIVSFLAGVPLVRAG